MQVSESSCASESRQVIPVDQASSDKSLREFRNNLLAALARKDVHAISGMLAPNVGYAAGGGAGLQAFADNWNIKDKNSIFWKDLPDCLKHGGYFDKNEEGRVFHAPYYRFYFDDETANDEDLRAVVKEKDVPMYAKADRTSKIVRTCGYDLLDVTQDNPDGPWTSVRTLNHNVKGWIESKYLRFASDNFVELKKLHGTWRIVFYGSQSL